MPPSALEHERIKEKIDSAQEKDVELPSLSSRSFGHALVEACGGDAAQAERIGRVVLAALSDRITPGEARHLAAQLPEPYKSVVHKQEREGVQKMDREILVARVARDLGTDVPGAVRSLRIVFRVLEHCISGGEISDVSSQLPQNIRTLLH